MTNRILLKAFYQQRFHIKSATEICANCLRNPLSSPHTPIQNPPPDIFLPIFMLPYYDHYGCLLCHHTTPRCSCFCRAFYKVCKIDTIPDPTASTTTSLSNTACRVPQPSTRTISDIMGTHGLLSSMLNSFSPSATMPFLTRCVDFKLWNCRSGSRAIQEPYTQQDLLED
ncbi:hypothetical protein CEXT_646801 [Caerostris extrusa]|uniref:Uncharacterized protein n=1 Tax=Caerostris extrusa TaxID=172846 RepID=A0AAV4UHN5_CAEEX|nr:hypothetical protein CEXT_646801 [Caerostris extrusa]